MKRSSVKPLPVPDLRHVDVVRVGMIAAVVGPLGQPLNQPGGIKDDWFFFGEQTVETPV